MNLLTDQWIPVREKGMQGQVALHEILCTDRDFRLNLPRDDMELAALQLLISLTQVLFMPGSTAELRDRLEVPMSREGYTKVSSPFQSWFDLEHPDHPFMQTKGVSAKETTPIQKIFIGLPEGNNHAFFNEVTELRKVCPGAAVIALFNQASNCPSFGGGFKGSLRGSTPITTLASDATLRATIWVNVLVRDSVENLLPWQTSTADKPIWVDPVKSGEKVDPHHIGILRGLFWQPNHLHLIRAESGGTCDLTGHHSETLYTGFLKEKFVYDLSGTWPHPHSPKKWEVTKNETVEKYLSFTTMAPAWTQLNQFVIRQESEKGGHTPAPVISQFRQVFAAGRPLHLTVGGYRSNKASVLLRRHEMFSLPTGWDESHEYLSEFVDLGLQVRKILRDKLYGFGKQLDLAGLANEGEAAFFFESEPLVHQHLRGMDWLTAADALEQFKGQLVQLARVIFERLTQPYRHAPKMLQALAASRRSFNGALANLY